MAGESLFNDGIAVVVFTVLLAIASSGEADKIDFFPIAELFFYEALGGAVLGFASGYIAYAGMRAIDDFPVEILISLALVTGTYALATRLHMSGPISVVVAGLLVGNRGPHDAMSDQTQRYLFGFWTVIDEILNSVLFLLIGLEVVVLRFDASFAWLMALAVPLTLAGRALNVSIPVLLLNRCHFFAKGTIPVLIWGGLRGGISVALALSARRRTARLCSWPLPTRWRCSPLSSKGSLSAVVREVAERRAPLQRIWIGLARRSASASPRSVTKSKGSLGGAYPERSMRL